MKMNKFLKSILLTMPFNLNDLSCKSINELMGRESTDELLRLIDKRGTLIYYNPGQGFSTYLEKLFSKELKVIIGGDISYDKLQGFNVSNYENNINGETLLLIDPLNELNDYTFSQLVNNNKIIIIAQTLDKGLSSLITGDYPKGIVRYMLNMPQAIKLETA